MSDRRKRVPARARNTRDPDLRNTPPAPSTRVHMRFTSLEIEGDARTVSAVLAGLFCKHAGVECVACGGAGFVDARGNCLGTHMPFGFDYVREKTDRTCEACDGHGSRCGACGVPMST